MEQQQLFPNRAVEYGEKDGKKKWNIRQTQDRAPVTKTNRQLQSRVRPEDYAGNPQYASRRHNSD